MHQIHLNDFTVALPIPLICPLVSYTLELIINDYDYKYPSMPYNIDIIFPRGGELSYIPFQTDVLYCIVSIRSASMPCLCAKTQSLSRSEQFLFLHIASNKKSRHYAFNCIAFHARAFLSICKPQRSLNSRLS